jgi:DNA-binding transcriptional MerR regulator
MPYTVQQLADIAGVSVRTLHYYDEVGLLSPAFVKANGYRYYEEQELLRLQQILFFKELDFPILEIKRIIDSPSFDLASALEEHRKLLELKKKRLNDLTKTIDKTLKKIMKEKNMEDKELYDAFSDESVSQYAEEAKQRWGSTDAYKQSQERVKKMTKEDMARIKKAGEDLTREIAAVMDKAPSDASVQILISRHYDGLRAFYEPSLQMYRGLGDMYVNDPRFTAYYEKYAVGLAQFMRDAMHAFADAKEK